MGQHIIETWGDLLFGNILFFQLTKIHNVIQIQSGVLNDVLYCQTTQIYVILKDYIDIYKCFETINCAADW